MTTPTPDHQSKPEAEDLELEVEALQDLPVDEQDAENVQGGQSNGASQPAPTRNP